MRALLFDVYMRVPALGTPISPHRVPAVCEVRDVANKEWPLFEVRLDVLLGCGKGT